VWKESSGGDGGHEKRSIDGREEEEVGGCWFCFLMCIVFLIDTYYRDET